MSITDIQTAIGWIGKLGVLGVVLFFLLGFQQEWWYFPARVRELKEALAEQKEATKRVEKDRDQWQWLYLTSRGALERATTIAQEVAALPPLPALPASETSSS